MTTRPYTEEAHALLMASARATIEYHLCGVSLEYRRLEMARLSAARAFIAVQAAALKAEAKEPGWGKNGEPGGLGGFTTFDTTTPPTPPPAFTVSEEVARVANDYYWNCTLKGGNKAMRATLEKYVPIIAAEVVAENAELKADVTALKAQLEGARFMAASLTRERDDALAELSRYREPSDAAISRAINDWLLAETHGEGVLAVLAAVREG